MKMKIHAAALLLLVASVMSAAAASMAIKWYVNMKFSYSIAYPVEILIPQGEDANATGQKFVSRDGKAVASVYGYDAPANSTLRSVYNETLLNIENDGSGWKFSQKLLKNNMFILAGENDKRKFHKRVVHMPTEKRFVSFEAVYLKSKSASYDTVITTMSNSLKMLQGKTIGM